MSRNLYFSRTRYGHTNFGTQRLPQGTVPLFRDHDTGAYYALDLVAAGHPHLRSVTLGPHAYNVRTASVREYVPIGESGQRMWVAGGRLLFGAGDATITGSRVVLADPTTGRYELLVDLEEYEVA